MAVMQRSAKSRADYTKNHRSGGALRVPKTPVERIMLDLRLRRMKRDYLRRQAEHGS